MNTIFTVLGTLGSVFAMVMTVLSMINYRKPRKISVFSTFLSGLISLLSLAAMVWLGGMRLASYLSAPLFMVGLTLGYLRGAGVKLNWEDGLVIGRNSILFLILWGFSLALSQLLGLFGSPLLASLGLIPVFFTTGLQAGLFGHLFLRRLIMGRKGKAHKGLQTVFSIAAGIFLLLITFLTLIVEIPEAMAADRGISSASAVSSSSNNSNSSELQASSSESVTALVPGELPTSGKLVFNLSEEIERQKEFALGGFNFIQYDFTFEEAFNSFEISLDVGVDFTNRTLTFTHEQTEGWNQYILFPDLYEEGDTLTFHRSTSGEGNIAEDGWISGTYETINQSDSVDSTPYGGENEFYGYIDDQLENVVFCLLDPHNDFEDDPLPNQYSADFDTLRTAGKDQLIPSWVRPFSCYICKIDGIKP